MKIVIYSLFVYAIAISTVSAGSSSEHAPSFLDLKYPFVNFIIMLAILSKIVKPLREKFNKEAENVKTLMDSAAKNSEDAKNKLKQFEVKMQNLDSELVKITSEYETDAVRFAQNTNEETQTMITRFKRDLQNKLEGERKELVDQLSNEIINTVISKAQGEIRANKDYQNKATNKIVSQL